MSEQRILELEQQLITTNETVTKLTLSNAELTKQLSDAESRNKKLLRTSRRSESTFREQLSTAQNRRF